MDRYFFVSLDRFFRSRKTTRLIAIHRDGSTGGEREKKRDQLLEKRETATLKNEKMKWEKNEKTIKRNHDSTQMFGSTSDFRLGKTNMNVLRR